MAKKSRKFPPNQNTNKLNRLFQEASTAVAEKKFDKAIKLLNQVIAKNNRFSDAYNLLGAVYFRTGNYSKAIENYKKALDINPGNPIYLNNYGTAVGANGDHKTAVKIIGEAIKKDINYVDAYNNMGMSLMEIGDIENAIQCFQKTLQLSPNHIRAMNNMATALRKDNKHDKAIKIFIDLLDKDPDNPNFLNNIGITLNQMGKYEEAASFFVQALNFDSKNSDIYNNLGHVLYRQGKFQPALEAYQLAEKLNPEQSAVKWNIALINLSMGNLKNGWEYYEWGYSDVGVRVSIDFKKPQWDGKPKKDEKVIVLAEQGLGDEILFASCYKDILKDVNNCYINCDERLYPLFKRSFPSAKFVIGRKISNLLDLNTELPDVDYQVFAGTLPKYYRKSIDSFPKEKGFLVADKQVVDRWKEYLKKHDKKLKVGLAWRSGLHTVARSTNYTQLYDWLEILKLPDIQFINLQYDEMSQQEVKNLKNKHNINIITPENLNMRDDLDGLSALLSSLDIVVGAGTATVSLASALGIETWKLTTINTWTLLGTNYSPWYPSQKPFIQQEPTTWENELKRIKEKLMQRT